MWPTVPAVYSRCKNFIFLVLIAARSSERLEILSAQLDHRAVEGPFRAVDGPFRAIRGSYTPTTLLTSTPPTSPIPKCCSTSKKTTFTSFRAVDGPFRAVDGPFRAVDGPFTWTLARLLAAISQEKDSFVVAHLLTSCWLVWPNKVDQFYWCICKWVKKRSYTTNQEKQLWWHWHIFAM